MPALLKKDDAPALCRGAPKTESKPGVTQSERMGRRDRGTIEPGKRGGRPCIGGLRITVYDVLSYLAAGLSIDEVLADFPDLEREDSRAALAYAADRERRTVVAGA